MRFANGWRYLRLYPLPAELTAAAVKNGNLPCEQGAAMTRILDDILLFACATALVTGTVLAAATLLI